MLAKCANPSCLALFHPLADGRLFRRGTDPLFRSSNARGTEHFWSGEPCSAETTLGLTREGAVATTSLADALCDGPHFALNSVDRENGAFLRSIRFLPRSHPKST
jgi:hypothetical protein